MGMMGQQPGMGMMGQQPGMGMMGQQPGMGMMGQQPGMGMMGQQPGMGMMGQRGMIGGDGSNVTDELNTPTEISEIRDSEITNTEELEKALGQCGGGNDSELDNNESSVRSKRSISSRKLRGPTHSSSCKSTTSSCTSEYVSTSESESSDSIFISSNKN